MSKIHLNFPGFISGDTSYSYDELFERSSHLVVLENAFKLVGSSMTKAFEQANELQQTTQETTAVTKNDRYRQR